MLILMLMTLAAVLLTAAGLVMLTLRAFRLFEYGVNMNVNLHAAAMRGQLDGRPLPGLMIADLVVSVTTISDRLPTAALAIQSILLQTMRPARIILYLSQDIPPEEIPPALGRLREYGVEIAFVRDIGPYTKLIYALRDHPAQSIITIDDDFYYPAHMIETLLRTARAAPGAIVGNWVRRLKFARNGTVMPAKQGHLVTPKLLERDVNQGRRPISIGHDLFAYGTSGVLYPPDCFDERVFDEATFQALCPTEDDIWFKAMALLKGTPVASTNLGLSPRHFCIHGSQAVALRHTNYAKASGSSPAEEQIQRVFAHFDLYGQLNRLRQEA